MLFTYTDRSFGPKARPTAGQVLLVHECDDILEADAVLTAKTGLTPATDMTIWCRVSKATPTLPQGGTE